MGVLDDLFGGGAAQDAAAKNTGLINNYAQTGNQILQSGLPQATAPLESSIGSFAGLGQKYGAGTDMYLNALGVNGPAAQATAQQNFSMGPGAQQQETYGLSAIDKAHALAGNLGSGNTDLDALGYAQNNYNQQYGSWMQQLGGLVSPELQATSGGATAGSNLSNVYQNDTANQIGLLTGQTQGLVAQNNLVAQGQAQGTQNALNLGMNALKFAATV